MKSCSLVAQTDQYIFIVSVKGDVYPHLRVYQGCEGEVIEQVCEVLPNVGVTIFP